MQMRSVLLSLLAILLLACNTSTTPDGFTRPGWAKFQKAHPEWVEAVRFTQGTEKRRMIRDLYIEAVRGSSDIIEGHQKAQDVVKNKMTGAEVYEDVKEALLLYAMTAKNMNGATSTSFSELVLKDLEFQKTRLELFSKVTTDLLADSGVLKATPEEQEQRRQKVDAAKRQIEAISKAMTSIRSMGE